MDNLSQLKKILDTNKLLYKIHNFASAYDAVGAKFSEGLATLIFVTDNDKYLVVLKRDDCKINSTKIKKNLKVQSLNFCTEGQIQKVGFQKGTVCPLLLNLIERKGIKYYVMVDSKALSMGKCYCGSGVLNKTLEINAQDVLKYIKEYKTFDFGEIDPIKNQPMSEKQKDNVQFISLNEVKPTTPNFKDLVEKLKKEKINDLKLIKHKAMFDVDDYIAELGISYENGVSTLIFKSEKGYIGIYRRDDRKVDTGKLKKLLNNKKLEKASSQEVENNFNFTVGSVGVYHKNLKYVMDKKLLEKDFINGGAGDPTYDIRLKPVDLQKLSKATILDFTIPSERVAKKRKILTGDTPSGKLHLGHFVGTLENRVKLQYEFETYILLANVHAYANDFTQSEKINNSVYEVFLDNLAVGIDPNISTIYLESGIPETYEFYSFFLTMVRQARAFRNPTVKEEIIYKKLDPTIGFISYPILQAADILQFNADLVPVGEDQLPIIEQVREIARDFNKVYGQTFVVPKAKVGRVARLVGTDGKLKMSKSGGNSILLSDDEKTLKQKVISIFTDPNRIHASDPGKVEGNPVFIYHDTFNQNQEEVEDLKSRYKLGKVGDIEVKEKLFNVLNKFLKPIREKRKYYEDRPDEAKEILIEGTKRARKVVQNNIKIFREKIKINNLIINN